MDGREGMAMSGSASYYLNRGMGGSGTGSGSIAASGPQQTGFKALSNPNPNTSVHSNVRLTPVGSTFQIENQSPSNFSHGINMAVASSVSPGASGKKKRGRPRKYGPDGANMSLGLSPLSSTILSGSISSNTPKKSRGRPPGSGRKQQLAQLGEWMNTSAGLAFTPHVIHIGAGEDVAGKVFSFAQQRPRALCILSANGSLSAVTLREPTPAASTVTYEGRFEILCLSGSYLLAESGGPRNRTGGLSISVCSPDGHVIGGAIGGRLIAASPVQVVVCSFVYGGTKEKKAETTPKADKNSIIQSSEKSTPASGAPSQNATPHSTASIWNLGSRRDLSNPHTEIDLTRG